MKVVMINTSDRQGGAAVAASRLREALKETGIEVTLIVRDRTTRDPGVIGLDSTLRRRLLNQLRFLWERWVILLNNGFSRKKLFMVSLADTGIDLSRMAPVRQADIIHLHWINQGMLSLNDIRKLSALGKPVVWTLHDMWPVTGICHHAWGCDRYRSGCGACPFLNSDRSVDLSARIFRKKKTLYRYAPIHLVPVSRWLREKCRESALSRELPAAVIPNPIDTEFFSPGDRQDSRREAGLPVGKKILLLGAARIDDPVKGFSCLKAALKALEPEYREEVLLVLFGGVKNQAAALEDLPVAWQWHGKISDPEILRTLYRSADFFLAPSLEDNLPNTVMESLSCGTPVIGFQTGGIPEMVEHLQNGFLARRGNTQELARGLRWGLTEASQAKLSVRAREVVLSRFNIGRITEQYRNLYRDLCATSAAGQKKRQ
ncbi:MAG: glycosyltransferase family 4 protein [Rikenellaceae bacterium]|nr:glycosyltransferase family 4 protein [Rikenellaceae bacterium]